MCKTCIESLLSDREGRVCCPNCHTPELIPQDNVSKLPIAFFVANVIEANEIMKRAHEPNIVCKNCSSTGIAAAYCVDCASVQCVSCYNNHREMKVLSEHKVLEIKELDSCNLPTKMAGPMCSKHTSEKLELYCCDCESLVCIECAYLEHPKQNHSVKRAKEIVLSFKEGIKTSMASLAASETQLQGMLASTSQKIAALLEQERNIIQLIKEFSTQFIPSQMRDTILHKGQNLFKLAKNDLQSQVRSMELFQMKIRTVKMFLKYLDAYSCDEEFVSLKQIVCVRIELLKGMYRELKNGLVHVQREVCKELQLELKSDLHPVDIYAGKFIRSVKLFNEA